ncbi:MAG: pyruvate phosphate dikinase, pyruvate,orthophosphate dikinase [Candidatus Rokubacteria bacterium CSP1-6]|nr:MAG: pyruvate phosphate dikinase, pyruvate,orthophosphate dikinase [Candidatus Rokubacteria bacterium CSP1-6]
MVKYVYFFGGGKAEGSAGMRDLLGGKGCDLAEMTNLGIPVPPGFTITTEACVEYFRREKRHPDGMWDEVVTNLRRLESAINLRFGDPASPLLVSVRSGARVSMPGMMDTVLNLGLNDASVVGLARRTKNDRFAWDCYRRFVMMFGDVVLGLERAAFARLLDESKARIGAKSDPEVPAEALVDLVGRYKTLVREKTGEAFPQDPLEQLRLSIDAVFNSWNTQRAVAYRKIHGIPHDWGTGVSVMAMVFGNLGESSGTGVAFTRNPATGERRFFGEFLVNAQGEDVVGGVRTPEPITALQARAPKVYEELVAIKDRLERHYRDMQDVEFTVQDGTLYLLQTRSGKRTAKAAVRMAVEMVREGLIDKETALLRLEPHRLHELLHFIFDPTDKARAIGKGRLLAKGLPAGPGAAVGRVVFNADRAVEWAKSGQKVLLVRPETSPEDVAGMWAGEGILTSRGGLTSHAAVVARGMGKCCIVGAGDIFVDEERRAFQAGRTLVREGDLISIDGHTGEILLDAVTRIPPPISEELRVFLKWADETRTLGVRANADTPEDARKARENGGEGIGLVRTEHMFFQAERIPIVREMIMAGDTKARQVALEKLLPLQREDFIGIFRAMDGFPVTVRLLDPPLHEFLPKYTELLEEHTRLDALGINQARARQLEDVMAKVRSLQEANPMLGHRGCRLGITFPEIYEMQVRAIMEAACAVTREGVKVEPEIMIPLTGTVGEMKLTHEMTRSVADTVMADAGADVKYLIGTMIEVPRAALVADRIAEDAEFFSFGTNDLTQMTFGYSRDDIGKFLPFYIDRGLLPSDPFSVLDQEGVGELIRIGIERGRKTRPGLKVGICGEHGGEASSVEFCHRVGMTYVSCSPFMIPVARLAAAQARIKEQRARMEGPNA